MLSSKFTLFLEFDTLTTENIGRMYIGLCIFGVGELLNVGADHCIITLRDSEKDPNYYLPTGIFFEYAVCPNYLAEIFIWLGMWIAFPSLGTGIFFMLGCGNMIPRAISTLKFYKEKFGAKALGSRKAVIPYVL